MNFFVYCRTAIKGLLVLLITVSNSQANTPPSKPTNFTATIISSSSIQLNWDAASDDKEVKRYRIFLKQTKIGKTRDTTLTLERLVENTEYEFFVEASDEADARSPLASVTITTPAAEEIPADTPETNDQQDTGSNDESSSNTDTDNISGVRETGSSRNTPPSAPSNLTATVLSPTSVELNWDASIDDKEVKRYRIFHDQTKVGKTRDTNLTLEKLDENTLYQFYVEASDEADARSELASIIVNTSGINNAAAPVEQDETGASSENDLCTDNVEDKRNNTCIEVRTTPDITDAADTITLNGPPENWQIVFEDHFDGSGDIDTQSAAKKWRFETMQGSLHRAGNSGMDELGNTDVPDWRSPRGKRWSAWYDKYNEDNAYRTNGMLALQGLMSDEPDPTRPNDYMQNGELVSFGDSKLYTTWLDTWARVYDQDTNSHISDPDSPKRIFKYGYFETRINFSEMITPGFRVSMWLMPAAQDAEGTILVESLAYDDNGDNGVEIDIFEYEWISPENENRIQLSLLGGAAGKSGTNVDVSKYNIALHEGFHTIGLLWEADKLVWSIDGQVVKTVTDSALIPDVYSYLILSREMNSGVKSALTDSPSTDSVLESFPHRPRDPGLYAKNVWLYRDRLALDRALIDYVRIWQP